MRLASLIVTISVLVLGAADMANAQGSTRLDRGFEALVDRYLEEVRGVGAAAEPDTMSAESFARKVQVSRDLLEQLQAIDRRNLTFEQDIDWRFLESILESNIIEGEGVQRWRQDPRTYLNNRDVAYKVIADPRPVDIAVSTLTSSYDVSSRRA